MKAECAGDVSKAVLILTESCRGVCSLAAGGRLRCRGVTGASLSSFPHFLSRSRTQTNSNAWDQREGRVRKRPLVYMYSGTYALLPENNFVHGNRGRSRFRLVCVVSVDEVR